MLRDRAPAGMDIAAGEYGYDLVYFRRCLTPVRSTACRPTSPAAAALTASWPASALCDAATLHVSAHTAPTVSAHACTGVWHLRHLEYFHDHVRLEHMLFDGALAAQLGRLTPDVSRHGLGLKSCDVEQFRVA
jgi:hypothetical protein